MPLNKAPISFGAQCSRGIFLSNFMKSVWDVYGDFPRTFGGSDGKLVVDVCKNHAYAPCA